MSKKVVTSEYVSFGHPDKVADQISDAILDAYLEKDNNTRAGIETMIKDNIVVLGGEVKTSADNVNIDGIVRDTVDSIGYPKSHRLDGKSIKIINLIGEQSTEISNGVDRKDCDCIGAGDQGFVVGMASNETNEYLPLGVYVAKTICDAISKNYVELGPDTKTQVSVEYGGYKPIITSIVVSTMHDENLTIEEVRKTIMEAIENNFIGMDDNIYRTYIRDKQIEYYINANGTWNIGGPISDCGLTGRKIVVDQYGGYCNVGGGAFSGKDMSKVDRSGAYMCRYIAKNIVDAGLADEAKVELSYVISEPQPCAVNLELKNPRNTTLCDLSETIKSWVMKNIDLTPNGIINRFFPNGVKPIFANTAYNGHFGYNDNDNFYPWEKLDFGNELNEYIENKEIEFSEV